MRKLASIRRIDNITPIPNADAIETAHVGGWKVVVKKGEFAVGDLAVYLEIDSWVPTELAPFLSKGKEPREFNGVKGERLRSIKLRAQLSQGLLLPIDEKLLIDWEVAHLVWSSEEGNFAPKFVGGEDVSEILGIQKWERTIPAELAGVMKGPFPSQIPKTDQERVQNLTKEIEAAQGMSFELTEKLEGSSMTVYMIDGEFGVCSRNIDLKEDASNAFWAAARRYNIEEKLRELNVGNLAIQGELVGPGIQGNIYNLTETRFYVFDIFDIDRGEYLTPAQRRGVTKKLGLLHVPMLEPHFELSQSVEKLIALADGRSLLADTKREGIVFKQNTGGMSFKAISNAYLLNSDA